MSLERSTIDIRSWDGTISSGEFYISSCAFAEKWEKFNSALPQWSWCRCPKLLGVPSSRVEGYLRVDGIIPPRRCTMEDNHECDDGGLKETVCLEEEEFIDRAALVCMFCLFWCFRKKNSFESLCEMHDLSICPHLTMKLLF
ncbi:unnamed protein product [Cuscuta campestris]|uniref:Uncharacterized protein n=1 Tax=Cuscuta campestris TaxID=132261 RepID=A0A484KY93_9ASTE|nr:unnamed protein product [Cuscuta campestris]